MGLTAEQDAELQQDEPTEADTEATESAPASGEQAAEQTAEGVGGATEGAQNEAEGDKPAEEKTAEEQPKPEQQRAWRQVEAAKKAQVQIARARQQLGQEIQRVRGYEADLQTREATIAEREARVQPLLDALEKRDLNALVSLGFDYETFTRSQIEANTPDGIARRALEENRKLREQLEQDKKQREQQTAAQQQIAETRAVAQKLVEIVEQSADEAPELYAWAPERVATEGIAIRDAYFRHYRRMPTFGIVLDELQRRAKAEADVQVQRTTLLQQRRSGKTSDAGSAGKADTKGNSGRPGLPALDARGSSERGATPPRQKTEEEIDAECLAELRGLRR